VELSSLVSPCNDPAKTSIQPFKDTIFEAQHALLTMYRKVPLWIRLFGMGIRQLGGGVPSFTKSH